MKIKALILLLTILSVSLTSEATSNPEDQAKEITKKIDESQKSFHEKMKDLHKQLHDEAKKLHEINHHATRALIADQKKINWEANMMDKYARKVVKYQEEGKKDMMRAVNNKIHTTKKRVAALQEEFREDQKNFVKQSHDVENRIHDLHVHIRD